MPPPNNSVSTSTTSQVTNAINPVVVADNGGLAFSNVAGGNINQTVNNTTLDADVAIRAMDNTLTATQGALLFGNDAMRQSYAFSNNVLDFAQTNNTNTLAFAGSQTAAANATTQAAMGQTGAAYTNALAFAGKQTAVALDSLSESADRIDTAYKDAKGVLGTNVILVAIGAGVLVIYFVMNRNK
jgi:hypothetical protein